MSYPHRTRYLEQLVLRLVVINLCKDCMTATSNNKGWVLLTQNVPVLEVHVAQF